MDHYRKTSHSVYDNKYHLVWITKYRNHILADIIRGNVSPDHVHLFVSIPPQHSVSKVMQNIKGRSSRLLQQQFPSLRKAYWGRHLWAIGYFCATSGNVTDEMVVAYISKQGDHDDDDTFQITP